MPNIEHLKVRGRLWSLLDALEANPNRVEDADRAVDLAVELVSSASNDASVVAELIGARPSAVASVLAATIRASEMVEEQFDEALAQLRGDSTAFRMLLATPPVLSLRPLAARNAQRAWRDAQGSLQLFGALTAMRRALGGDAAQESDDRNRQIRAIADAIGGEAQHETDGAGAHAAFAALTGWLQQRVDTASGVVRLNAQEGKALLTTDRGREIYELLEGRIDTTAWVDEVEAAGEAALDAMAAHWQTLWADLKGLSDELIENAVAPAYADSGQVKVVAHGPAALLESVVTGCSPLGSAGMALTAVRSRPGAHDSSSSQSDALLLLILGNAVTAVHVDSRTVPRDAILSGVVAVAMAPGWSEATVVVDGRSWRVESHAQADDLAKTAVVLCHALRAEDDELQAECLAQLSALDDDDRACAERLIDRATATDRAQGV